MLVSIEWEIYMGFVAIFSLTSWIPQIWRIIQTKDTHSFSLITTGILIFVNGSWLAYSLSMGSPAFILQQALTCLMLAVFAVLVIKWRSPFNGGEQSEG